MTQSSAGSAAYRKSKYAEQNPDSKTWTAGIDALRSYPYQDRQWHLSAIEFHHKVKEEAEALRDIVFASLQPATVTSPDVAATRRDPEVVAAVQEAISKHPHFKGSSVTAFGFANTAIDAYVAASGGVAQ